MTNAPVRLLRHPGPVARERWHASVGRSSAYRVALRPGGSLASALVDAFADKGRVSAAVTLFGGTFSAVSYCLAAPRPGATQVAGYTDPNGVVGPVSLVAANATLGLTEDGEPLVHCHALFADRDGRLFGGHVVPDLSIVGSPSPTAFVQVIDGFSVRRRYDPETDMSVFHPADETLAIMFDHRGAAALGGSHVAA